MKSRIIFFFSTAVSLVAITTIVILWARGYRINRSPKGEVAIQETGILLIKSYPDGAKVYINEELETATNATLSGLNQGVLGVKISKEGYADWEKDVPIQKGLVTTLEATLIPLTPELKPLTLNGVTALSLSPQKDQVAYLTKNNGKSGVWILPLTGTSIFNRLGGGAELLAADQPGTVFSSGTEILWSPQEDEIVVKINPRAFYLISLSQSGTGTARFLTSIDPTLEEWEEQRIQKLALELGSLPLTKDIKAIAADKNTLWSPDRKKFLYQEERETSLEYRVYNLEKIKGVGEKETYTPLIVPKDKPVNVQWYSNSNHLIVVEDSSVSLIGLEGENKTKIYTGTLSSTLVFPNTAGTEIIIHTSFNESVEPNLYAIKLR